MEKVKKPNCQLVKGSLSKRDMWAFDVFGELEIYAENPHINEQAEFQILVQGDLATYFYEHLPPNLQGARLILTDKPIFEKVSYKDKRSPKLKKGLQITKFETKRIKGE